MRPCTRVDVLHREEKNTLCMKEALTRAPKTIVARRDAANFLSSGANYWRRREISPRIFLACKKCPWNADFSRVRTPRRVAREKRFTPRASAAQAPESRRRDRRRAVKKFLYNRAESASDRPRRGSNRANRRCPDSLQHVSRRDRDDQVARKCALRGRRRARTAVDPHLDRIGDLPKRRSRASIRADDAIAPAVGGHARAESGSALRRSRSLGYVEPHIGRLTPQRSDCAGFIG